MRNPSLRQLEALMAVIETGTVSRAAEVLHISQPAASKLVHDLEADTGLELFDRESGRLVPTGPGMRLYQEVERIFGGVHQLARAVEAIRREEHGQLVVGVMPALSGQFISRALKGFLTRHPNVFVTVEARSSQYLAEAVLGNRLDVALVVTGFEHTSLRVEVIHSPPMAVVMPIGHPLSNKREIEARELADERFIAYSPAVLSRREVDAAFAEQGVKPNIVIEAQTSTTLAECVATGLGVTVADPLSMESVSHRVVMRPFRPIIDHQYRIVRPIRARDRSLLADFIQEVHTAAATTPVTM